MMMMSIYSYQEKYNKKIINLYSNKDYNKNQINIKRISFMIKLKRKKKKQIINNI